MGCAAAALLCTDREQAPCMQMECGVGSPLSARTRFTVRPCIIHAGSRSAKEQCHSFVLPLVTKQYNYAIINTVCILLLARLHMAPFRTSSSQQFAVFGAQPCIAARDMEIGRTFR